MGRSTRGGNIFDLVLISEVGMVENLLVNENFSNSDNNVVIWNLVSSTVVSGDNKSENYALIKRNNEGINTYLTGIDWVSEFQELDVEGTLELFIHRRNYINEQYVLCNNKLMSKIDGWTSRMCKDI